MFCSAIVAPRSLGRDRRRRDVALVVESILRGLLLRVGGDLVDDDEGETLEQLPLRRQNVDRPAAGRIRRKHLLTRVRAKSLRAPAVYLRHDALALAVVPPLEDDLLREAGRRADRRERDDASRQILARQCRGRRAWRERIDRLRDSRLGDGKTRGRHLRARRPDDERRGEQRRYPCDL